MTSGTKILLALIALFVGVLVLYYGFLMPDGDATPDVTRGPARDVTVTTDPAPPDPLPPAAAVASVGTATRAR
ncbi:MAG: hypothetical protein HKN62_16690, partial [Phycisphaerales bacterium]|nr:hypothetical protein [Phycisphaerales bacterium]